MGDGGRAGHGGGAVKIRSLHPSFFSDARVFGPAELDAQRWPKGGITPHYVYHLARSGGRCLYVGITWDPLTRLRTHRRRSWWRQVSTIRVSAVPDEQVARQIEKLLIARHRPTHNRLTYGGG